METTLTIILLLVLNLLFLYLQGRYTPETSDHYFHIGLIAAIKKNKHRFIKKQPNLLGKKYFSYPQLFHWCLSFLSIKTINKHSRKFGIFLNQINLLVFVLFLFFIKDYLRLTWYSDFELIFISGLVFILTPFNFVPWNPKNRGISARILGVLLGNIHLYFLVAYFISQDYYLLVFLVLIDCVIILSSTFTYQYILFSGILFGVILADPLLVLIPFLAYGLFFLLAPRVALNYFHGQIGHKRIYYKYLASIYILNKRYSVWRDLVYDIWKNFLYEKKKARAVHYLISNPVIQIILAFPFFLVLLFFLFTSFDGFPLTNRLHMIFAIIIGVNLMIFLLTSFRWSRFLGEPERYFEYSIPFLSILALYLYHFSFMLFILLMSFSLFFISYNLNWYRNPKIADVKTPEHILRLLERLEQLNSEKNREVRFFSNNNDLPKYLLSRSLTVLRGNFTWEYTGTVHFTEMFRKNFGSIDENAWKRLIEDFAIDYFILDKNLLPNFSGINLEFENSIIEEIDNFSIYLIRR